VNGKSTNSTSFSSQIVEKLIDTILQICPLIILLKIYEAIIPLLDKFTV